MKRRVPVLLAVGIGLLSGALKGQELLPSHELGVTRLAQYRTFALKSHLPAVSTATGLAASEAKTIHLRPALLQDLEWRPSRWIPGSLASSTDPLEQVLFSFYNNQLFRIVADYARDRTEGMTDADMIEALTAVYGTPSRGAVAPGRVPSQVGVESGVAVAAWRDVGHTVVLYRTSIYGDRYRLIVTDSDLDQLARKAEAQAARLDEQEAPRREIARAKKERDDGRVAAEKARVANKKVFRP
jgi:hypothetical protein